MAKALCLTGKDILLHRGNFENNVITAIRKKAVSNDCVFPYTLNHFFYSDSETGLGLQLLFPI